MRIDCYSYLQGGFMGDIALPDINYDGDPIVAHTLLIPLEERHDNGGGNKSLSDGDDAGQWQSDSATDKPVTSIKFNASFQQELEILKQEVYHEGLQVEEEGLTHIIRKKTKLPSTRIDFKDSKTERSSNDPALVSLYTSMYIHSFSHVYLYSYYLL